MSSRYRILLDGFGVVTLPERPPEPLLKELVDHWSTAINKAAASPNLYEVANAGLPEDVVKSVALVCPCGSVNDAGNGRSTLVTESVGVCVNGVCVTQRAVRDAHSGFLVGDKLLLTTVHSLEPGKVPGNFKVVFDYKLVNGQAATTIDNGRIFEIAASLDFGDHYEGQEKKFDDWLLLELGGPTNRASGLTLAASLPHLSPPPPVPAGLWMIGHPLGLPMKATGRGSVSAAHTYHFDCNLSAWGGSSGSLVVDETASTIVGTLKDDPEDPSLPTYVTSSATFKSRVEWAETLPNAFPLLRRVIRWVSRKPHGPVPALPRRASRRRRAA